MMKNGVYFVQINVKDYQMYMMKIMLNYIINMK